MMFLTSAADGARARIAPSGRLGTHDSSVSEAAAHAEEDDVPKTRLTNLMRAGQQEAQIALFVPVQEPVSRVRARIERIDQAEIAIDANKEKGAVDTMSLHVGCVVIGRSDPRAGLSDNGRAL